MQTHGRELLLLILDSATGANVWVLEPQAAYGAAGWIIQISLFFFFLVVVMAVVFLSFSFIIFCLFFFFSPSPALVKKRTLLKP